MTDKSQAAESLQEAEQRLLRCALERQKLQEDLSLGLRLTLESNGSQLKIAMTNLQSNQQLWFYEIWRFAIAVCQRSRGYMSCPCGNILFWSGSTSQLSSNYSLAMASSSQSDKSPEGTLIYPLCTQYVSIQCGAQKLTNLVANSNECL